MKGIARRDAVVLASVGILAAIAGAVLGPIALQTSSGAAALQRLRLRDPDGRERQISGWSGRILVCNFWATWCAPCREEIPLLISVRGEYLRKGVEIVGIAIDSADKVREFSRELSIPYPILIGDGSAMVAMKRLGNRSGALPFTVIVDRTGAVTNTRLGLLTRIFLETSIGGLVGSGNA